MVEDIHTNNNIAMKLVSTPGLTYTHILNDIVSPPRLSLIRKTQIRGLDALNLPLFGNWRQPFEWSDLWKVSFGSTYSIPRIYENKIE
jgi:hypothetical protein